MIWSFNEVTGYHQIEDVFDQIQDFEDYQWEQ